MKSDMIAILRDVVCERSVDGSRKMMMKMYRQSGKNRPAFCIPSCSDVDTDVRGVFVTFVSHQRAALSRFGPQGGRMSGMQ
jgi:hypothetical protein